MVFTNVTGVYDSDFSLFLYKRLTTHSSSNIFSVCLCGLLAYGFRPIHVATVRLVEHEVAVESDTRLNHTIPSDLTCTRRHGVQVTGYYNLQ
jgi:hypothetical protein